MCTFKTRSKYYSCSLQALPVWPKKTMVKTRMTGNFENKYLRVFFSKFPVRAHVGPRTLIHTQLISPEANPRETHKIQRTVYRGIKISLSRKKPFKNNEQKKHFVVWNNSEFQLRNPNLITSCVHASHFCTKWKCFHLKRVLLRSASSKQLPTRS